MNALLRRRCALMLVAAVAVLVPVVGNSYVLTIACRIVIYAILAISLDVIVGYGGLVSFGHAAFFGVGAYAIGALAFSGVSSGFIAFPVAIASAAIVAAVVGAFALRTRGAYFIMLTLAFAQMLYYLAVGQQLFGGDDGIGLPQPNEFAGRVLLGNPIHLYIICIIALVITIVIVQRLVHSRFGLVLRACRQNETRLLAIGIPTYQYNLIAFTIAGAIAGLAGALIANLEAYISPNYFSWNISGLLIMMLVIGGVGTVYGPILGAAAYIGLQLLLTPITTHWMAIFGPILVLAALFWRRGLWGILVPYFTARRSPLVLPASFLKRVRTARSTHEQ